MKKILITLCLTAAITAMAQHRVTFKFSDGLKDATLKTRMEAEISKLLTEINQAAADNRSLSLKDINMTREARTALKRRWERSSHFRCTEKENVKQCLTAYQGYMARDISINLLNPEIKGDRSRNLCVRFSKEGTIIDVHPQLVEYSLQQLVDNSYPMEDQIRMAEIVDWVEQFRSYYDEKDITSLEKVFSDDALIITGRVIHTKRQTNDMATLRPDVEYKQQSKKEYLKNLIKVFKNNSYIKLSFSDYHIGRHGTKDHIFWVGLKQRWDSQYYSDDGYLFLVWQFPDDGSDPVISVRTWQPDLPERRLSDYEKFNINDFFTP